MKDKPDFINGMTDLEISKYKETSSEALKSNVGKALIITYPEFYRHRGPEEGSQAFDNWYKGERNNIRALICKRKDVRDFTESKTSNLFQLFRTVADALAGLYSPVQLPIGSLTEIVIRENLSSFCAHEWKSA